MVAAILSCLFLTPGIEVIGNRLGFCPFLVIRRDTPIPILMLYCIGENERNTLRTEAVNDLFHTRTVKPVICVVAGNYLYDAYRRTAFLYFIFSVQLKTFNLCNNSLLPLVEQQLFVMGEIFLAAVSTDKMCAVVADGQLCHEN